jgi:hypothetical protein
VTFVTGAPARDGAKVVSMAEDSEESSGTRYNAANTRVTIAFPFSSIKLHEPDDRVIELAEVVGALAERLSELAPGHDTAQLVERARASLAAFKS